jgi:hypothetical protein
MSSLRIPVCLLCLTVVLTACSDSTSPPPVYENELTGTVWAAAGMDDDGTELFSAVDELAGEVTGYAFAQDGELVHRTAGWCGTPPLTFTDVPGVWALDGDGVLDLAHAGALPDNPLRYEIVRHTARELHLRRLEIEPPAHPTLQGAWKGTFVIGPTNPQVGAPAEAGQVTFTIQGSTFHVVAERALVPPSADGLLAVGDVIALRDLSVHTADYDWGLNINGHFTWRFEDEVLVLRQLMRDRADAREFRLRRIIH